MKPEDTTTSVAQDTTLADESSEPAELETTQAVQEDTEERPADEQPTTSEDSDDLASETQGTEDDSANSDEAELLEWAKKKGVKTDDPVALLKMVRESETKMHAATAEARKLSDTTKALGEADGVSKEEALYNSLTVKEFYLDNPDAKNYDEGMAKILEEKPYLSSDLTTLYKLAKYDTTESNLDTVRKQARQEALAQAAKAESAAPPTASASTRETSPSYSLND